MAMRDVTFQSEHYGMAFQYPAARLKPAILLSETSGVSPLIPAIFSGSGPLQRPFTLSIGARKESVQLAAIDPTLYLGTSAPLSLAIEHAHVAGKAALRVRYAYLTDGRAEAGGLPTLLWASTDIIPTQNYTYVFTFEAAPEPFQQQEWLYERILESVRWMGE
jgi:hypothetical protein